MPTTLAYGPHPSQVGDVYLPDAPGAPVVCLFHGGFWRMPYGRDQMIPLAEDLVALGMAVWNVEYRRLGEGGGWPSTLEDVAASIDFLAERVAQGDALDLSRVATVGHSAGGQLALWVAGGGRPGSAGTPRVKVRAAVGQAAVSDLNQAADLHLSDDVASEWLGGSPAEVPDRYAFASPHARLPLGLPHLLVHGTEDDVVPVAMSRAYARAARAAGDAAALVEVPGAGHFVHLDVQSPAWAAVRGWLLQELGPITV